MRKQLISFGQVIKFCKISCSIGGFNPKHPLRTPLPNHLVTRPVTKGRASPPWKTFFPSVTLSWTYCTHNHCFRTCYRCKIFLFVYRASLILRKSCVCPSFKVARRPWAPRAFLKFAIKTDYVLDPWKTFCCPWLFSGVLENSWTVMELFIIELILIEHSTV